MNTSLIITIYNEEDNLPRFLSSYLSQSEYADEFIIVDGGSTDSSIKILKGFANENPSLNIKIIVDETCSKKFVAGPIARGRNVAIRACKYEYILATDAGCLLSENWVQEIKRPFADSGADVVAGWYESVINTEFDKQFADEVMPSIKDVNPEEFLPSSRSIAFTKSAWSAAGFYPEHTYTGEDTLYDLNLKKSGSKFFFAGKAVVFWEAPRDINDAKKKYESYGFGDGQLKIIFWKFMFRSFLNLKNKWSKPIKYELIKSYQLGYLKGLLRK